LRTKLLLGVMAAVCAALAVQFAIAGDRVGDDLAALEEQRMDENLRVALNALEQVHMRLERGAAGASVDLALAAAVERGDGRWIERHVLAHVALNERVQSAAVLAADGSLLRSVGQTLPDLGTETTVLATKAKMVKSSMIYRDGHLWVLAAAPIVPRSYEDDAVGALVLGLVVDHPFAQTLKSVVGTDIAFVSEGVVAGATARELAAALMAPEHYAVLEKNDLLVTETTASKARGIGTPGVTTHLVVSSGRAPIATAAAAMHRSIFLSLLPALALATIVGVLLSVQLGRSVRRLSRAVDAMTFGDLSTRVVLRGHDELTDLGRAFNAMAERVAEAQETLWRAAVRDSLTGLLNHREFYRRLEEEVARSDRDGRPLSVLMIDLDDFKGINDTRGHLRGDGVLREVGKVLESCVREQDVLARYAGDEFAVVLTGTGGRTARVIAERIRRRTAEISDGAARISGRSVPSPSSPVTLSIGVATRQPGVEPLADLMERADHALYRAKDGGRDRVVVAAPAAQSTAAGERHG
jgi:diguanylate cyclase (GGDEF)-like protein